LRVLHQRFAASPVIENLGSTNAANSCEQPLGSPGFFGPHMTIVARTELAACVSFSVLEDEGYLDLRSVLRDLAFLDMSCLLKDPNAG